MKPQCNLCTKEFETEEARITHENICSCCSHAYHSAHITDIVFPPLGTASPEWASVTVYGECAFNLCGAKLSYIVKVDDFKALLKRHHDFDDFQDEDIDAKYP